MDLIEIFRRSSFTDEEQQSSGVEQSKNQKKKEAHFARRLLIREEKRQRKQEHKHATLEGAAAAFVAIREACHHPVTPPPRQERVCRGTVLFDTNFGHLMLPKERASLVSQIARAHGSNKKALCSLYKLLIGPLSKELQLLFEKFCASNWENVILFPQDDNSPTISATDQSRRILYLSADSDQVLTAEEMGDPSLCLVIGGLVDRNRHKGKSIERALSLSVPTARLPIRETGIQLSSSCVLTVNQGIGFT